MVLVDGEPVVCRLLRARLAVDERFAVLGHAATAAAGVELVTTHQPDVVLLDVGLPGVSGLTAIPRVVACAPGTRILVYAAIQDEAIEREAFARGADFVADS
ncbi:MAG TPA: response regulator transcription factor, partial [Acidimicrobiales bacterium]|nr:response regulator transcription factor [Acidimicrobiales bacterium]